jgi:guanylate kinase
MSSDRSDDQLLLPTDGTTGSRGETRGLLFVVSAPSGTGKTTLVERLVAQVPNLKLSRSYTSRPARAGEIDGVDYNFISRERFQAMIDAGEFLESAELFGNLYGTGALDTERALRHGHDLVLVIDVEGAQLVRGRGLETVAVFIMPPSFETLEQRLRGRRQETEHEMRLRLHRAVSEVAAYAEYDYVIVNQEIDESADRLRAIVTAERARLKPMRRTVERIVHSFGHLNALDGGLEEGKS